MAKGSYVYIVFTEEDGGSRLENPKSEALISWKSQDAGDERIKGTVGPTLVVGLWTDAIPC